MRVGHRRRDQRRDPAQPVRRERDRAAAAVGADRAAGGGGEADEPLFRPALDAAVEVRHVAGEPEQLQLEREHERVERRPRRSARGDHVEPVEKARQRRECALVRLLLGEELQHRLGADQPDREPIGILARLVVGGAQVGSGHRLQLAGALVEHQLDVRERLEPAAEARLRAPDALRDRADAATVGGVDVEHAVGLAEPERTEHDRFGSVRPGHPPSLERAPDGNRPGHPVLRSLSRMEYLNETRRFRQSV